MTVRLVVFALIAVSSILAQDSGGSRIVRARDYQFNIDAAKVWLDTGIDLAKGDLVHVYGGVLACGGPALPQDAHLPSPSAPVGGLVMKLHPDAPPVLASPEAELPVMDLSHLYLGVNGWNCSGKLAARVHIEKAKR
jgi:hypothetical protein